MNTINEASERVYQIDAVHMETGKHTRITRDAMNHKQCMTMVSKMTSHAHLRYEIIEEHTETSDPVATSAQTTPVMVSSDFAGDIPLSLAISAYGGVSMSPERRGQSAKSEYAQSMAEDYATLHAQAVKGGALDLLPEVFARYRAHQASAYRAYLSSSSRCVSSFIAGPSNFPVARMNKRNDITHRRLTEYLDGGQMALQAAIRTLRPDLRAIMAGDADAIDRLTVELEAAERLQNQMKACNKAIRVTAKMDEAHKVAALMEIGYGEAQAVEILNPPAHYGRGPGFPSFRLTNNQANIRRMRARLEQITAAKARPVESVECTNGVTLEDDAPANRVRLYFQGKPSEEIRAELKSSGFRWAPSVGAWQAYRNYGALATARRMAGDPMATRPEPVAAAEIEATPPVVESAEAHAPVTVEFLTETVEVFGRNYGVVASFPESEMDKANSYMETNRDTGCIAIERGTVFVSKLSDKGAPAARLYTTCSGKHQG